MGQFDIEAFLSGELTDAQKTAFEAEMKRNPKFAAEVTRMRQLTADLEMIGLRQTVKDALVTPIRPATFSYKWGFIAILLLIVVSYFLLFQKEKFPSSEKNMDSIFLPSSPSEMEKNSPIDTLEDNLIPILQSNKKTEEQKDAIKKRMPIDQPIAITTLSEKLAPPLFPAPSLRGENANSEIENELLNAIWYTTYPPENAQLGNSFEEINQFLAARDFSKAFIRLQFLERKMPANDSLFFLKSYCLLEMGEGGEALRYFKNKDNQVIIWESTTEWYRGLALLMTDNQAQAVATFESISQKNNHPFQQQAIKALSLIK